MSKFSILSIRKIARVQPKAVVVTITQKLTRNLDLNLCPCYVLKIYNKKLITFFLYLNIIYNYLIISIEPGRQTQYCHMKTGKQGAKHGRSQPYKLRGLLTNWGLLHGFRKYFAAKSSHFIKNFKNLGLEPLCLAITSPMTGKLKINNNLKKVGVIKKYHCLQ